MSSIKISQLPQLPSIAANTSNTLFLGVDQPTGITGKFTATTLAEQLYANNALTVGNNIILFSNTVGQLSGYDPTFLQTNMQNFNANGSGDFVITGDKGTNSNNFIDMGLSGSDFQTNPTVGTAFLPNDGYLYVQGPDGAYVGNLLIGTGTTNTKILFAAGGLNVENIVGYIDEDGAHFTNLENEIAANLVTAMAYTNTKIAVVNSNNGNTATLAQAAFNTANTANVAILNTNGQINILQSQLASNANAIVALTGYSQSAYATINSIAISSNTANLALQTQAAFNTANNNANVIASILVVNSVQNNAINLAIQNTSTITVSHNLYVPGRMLVNNSTFLSNSSAAAITGSNGFARQMPANDGYMLHITGKDSVASRLVVDSFGSNTYSLFTGRSGRGSANTPLPTGNGDVIARYSSSSFAGNTGFQPLGVGRMDFVATEDHTDTNRGTQVQIYAIPNGSNTLTRILTMDGATASFTGNVIATNLTVTGNVTAQNFVGNTAFVNATFDNLVANTATVNSLYFANNSITSSNTSEDITIGLVSSSANVVINRFTNFSKGIRVTGNVYAGNTVLNNGIEADRISLNDGGVYRYNVATNNATVTQSTSKTTSVTANARTGQITTNNSSVAGNRSATFTVNNNYIVSAADVVIVNIASGASTNSYAVSVTNINSAGSFDITISNVSSGALAEALVINFAVIRVS